MSPSIDASGAGTAPRGAREHADDPRADDPRANDPRTGDAGDHDACLRVRGHGVPLVYVPGMDGTGELFYRQVPRLERRFRVATYRLRDAAPDMETLVADLARVIAAVAPDGAPAVLVAESFGGALAMSLTLARPELVRALVVLNSFPHFRPQYRLRLAIGAIGLMPWGAMRVVRRLTAFRLHSPHTHRAEIRRFLQLTAPTTRAGYLSRLRILRRYDLRERLAELRVPTLFLAADRDHLIPSVEQARLMSARTPGAVMRVLPGHGHSCFLAHDVDLDAILHAWPPTSG
jgi:pimeloyl-ACP methyl ester carboxylesterase